MWYIGAFWWQLINDNQLRFDCTSLDCSCFKFVKPKKNNNYTANFKLRIDFFTEKNCNTALRKVLDINEIFT